MKRTNNQNRQIYALLNQTGLLEQKENLVHTYTDGRTHRSSEMYSNEADDLIHYLENYKKASKDKSDTMRKKILHYAHLLKWENADGKVNMNKVDSWCIKYGYKHKALQDHTTEELTMLVSQFERMVKQRLNSI